MIVNVLFRLLNRVIKHIFQPLSPLKGLRDLFLLGLLYSRVQLIDLVREFQHSISQIRDRNTPLRMSGVSHVILFHRINILFLFN